MANLRLRKKKNMSAFRKIALGTWKTAKDPQVYGSVTVRMDEALRYRDAFREKTGKKLQVTHMIAKLMSESGIGIRVWTGRSEVLEFIF